MPSNTKREQPYSIIRLGGALGKKFGRVHRCVVNSPADALRMLAANYPEFTQYMLDNQRTHYRVLVGDAVIDPENDLHLGSGTKEIRFMPMIHGAKRGGVTNIILGASLVALAFMTASGAPLAAWASMGTRGLAASTLFSMGISQSLGGVASLLSPQPKLGTSDSPENRPNENFSGPVNTQAEGYPVPLAYGEVICGSAVISAGIYSEDMNS